MLQNGICTEAHDFEDPKMEGQALRKAWPPLYIAVVNGHVGCVNLLLEAKVSSSSGCHGGQMQIERVNFVVKGRSVSMFLFPSVSYHSPSFAQPFQSLWPLEMNSIELYCH